MSLLQKNSTKLAVLILLGVIWGTGYSIARLAMTHDVPPLGYSFWQSLGPALLVSLIAFAYTRGQAPFAVPTIGALKYYLICGFLGIFIPNTCMYFAAAHLPAGILALIVNIVPIITYPLALVFRLETFNLERMMGILAACLGILFIILPKSSLPSSDMLPWVLITLITPLSFALCSVFISLYRPPQSHILTSTAGMLIFSSLLLLPFVYYAHSFYSFHLPFSFQDKIIFLEILLSSIGYILLFYLIKIAGPVYYSLVDTVVVLTGLFWGRLIFDEHLNQWTASAVCLIIIALLLVTKQQRISVVEPCLTAKNKA